MTKEFKFEVGQKVKVVDDGECYPYYRAWAEANNFEQAPAPNEVSLNNLEGVVFVRDVHRIHNDELLYGVEINGENYIFAEDGLEAVEDDYEEAVEENTHTIYLDVELENLKELRDLLLEIETIKNRVFK